MKHFVPALALVLFACDDHAHDGAHDHAHDGAHDHGAGGQAAVESAEAEACEHLAEGPAAAVAAVSPGTAGAPSVSDDHKRYDITLSAADNAATGVVEFASEAAGEHSFFFNAEVGLQITGPDGTVLTADHAHTSSTLCTDIKLWAVYDLDVGTYTLQLTTAEPVTVGLVIEAGHGHAE
jgi:hypothetical protein